MSRKIRRFSREWLEEALGLSLSSVKAGEDALRVAERLRGALEDYVNSSRRSGNSP